MTPKPQPDNENRTTIAPVALACALALAGLTLVPGTAEAAPPSYCSTPNGGSGYHRCFFWCEAQENLDVFANRALPFFVPDSQLGDVVATATCGGASASCIGIQACAMASALPAGRAGWGLCEVWISGRAASGGASCGVLPSVVGAAGGAGIVLAPLGLLPEEELPMIRTVD